MQQFYIDTAGAYVERFSLGKFMEFLNNDNFDVLNSYMLNTLKTLPSSGFVTYTGLSYRPDLLSEQCYSGDSQYWWVLMMYNGLSSADDLIQGNSYKYPSLSDLEDVYFSLKLKQSLL